MTELQKIQELTNERIELEEKLKGNMGLYKEKYKEFMKQTKRIRSLIKEFKKSISLKQSQIDAEVMGVMKTFNRKRTINVTPEKK